MALIARIHFETAKSCERSGLEVSRPRKPVPSTSVKVVSLNIYLAIQPLAARGVLAAGMGCVPRPE